MKKLLFLVLVFIAALFLVSCDKAANKSADQTAGLQAEETGEPIIEEATSEPTEQVMPTSTPDADPYVKLLLSQDESSQLIHFWLIDGINVEEQGALNNLSASFNGSFLNLNYFFYNSNSMDSLKALYSEYLPGEWEKDEYAAGPVLSSKTSAGDSAYIQIVDMGSQNELSAFLSTDNAEAVNQFEQLFYSKWPVAFAPMSELISNDNIETITINIFPQEPRTVYSVGYVFSGEAEEILEFYKDALAGYENFNIGTSYDGSEIITCAKDEIDICVYFDSFWNQLIIEYTIYE